MTDQMVGNLVQVFGLQHASYDEVTGITQPGDGLTGG
jgi:hypothetical protein